MGEKDEASQACENRAVREKYWRELGVEEKLERMRQVLHQRGHQIDELERRLDTAANQFQSHKHVDGQVVIPTPGQHPAEHYGYIGGGNRYARLGATTKNSEDFYF